MSTDTTDYGPAGIVDDRDVLLTTLRTGDVAATLTPIDWGLPTGGRWVIDAQSVPGLFSISYNPATDTTARLVVSDAALLPPAGSAVTVTAHYYDRYQIDGYGNPLPGRGVAETLVYNFEAGSTRDLEGFGSEFALGSAASSANPDLATLSTGAFMTVWQAANGSVVGQLRDAGGAAQGAVFNVSSSADAAVEGAPSVAALAGGRSVVAYTSTDGAGTRVAYRVVDAAGNAGAEVVLAGPGLDTAMPDVVALNDGSFAVAWRSGGQVHVRTADANGVPTGVTQVHGSMGTAFSPSIAATAGGYVVAWGEMGDGNVYAAQRGGAPILVSGDGLAASIATAAPQPVVTALVGGGFVVTWDSYANSPWGFASSDIFFQRFDAAGNRVGGMTQANIDSGGGRFESTTVALADGGFAIAWQGADFDGNGVFGRRFGADGNALDAREFEINELRQGEQANPVLSALANGGFAAAWIDTQDNGAVQVEARVLAGAAPAIVTPALDMAAPAPDMAAPAPEMAAPAPAPVAVAPAPVTVAPAPAPAAPPKPAPAPSTASSGGSTSGTGTGTGAGSGSAAGSSISGSNAGNVIKAMAGNQKIDGLGGVDTIEYGGFKGLFEITRTATGATIVDRFGAGGTDTLVNVERLKFADVAVALDIEGTAGQAYRLYQAAFNRTPDKAGVGYWIKMMDEGATLEQVAAGFATSAEFKQLYGANASDAQFVELLYDNVLHRPAEGAGFDYWMKAISEQHVPREQVLAYFSESGENQAQVIGVIQNGIEFTPWG